MVRLLFAFTKPDEYRFLKRFGVRNGLVSYFYLRRWGNLRSAMRELRETFDFLLIDSGGHSFGEGKTVDWKEYADEYIAFAQEYADYFDAIASLDMPRDEDFTLEWFKYMHDAGTPKMMPVVQGDWYKCADTYLKYGYDYVGLGWLKVWAKGLDLYSWARRTLPRYPTLRVHGFAKVFEWVFRTGLFWSVDSTTWNYGEIMNIAIMLDRDMSLDMGRWGWSKSREGKMPESLLSLRKAYMQGREMFDELGFAPEKKQSDFQNAVYILLWARRITEKHGQLNENFKY